MPVQVKRAKGETGSNTTGLHGDPRAGREVTEQRCLECHAQLQELALKSVLTEERERRRIAMGLHDDLGQNLATARLLLDGLADSKPGEQAIRHVEVIRGLIDQSIQTIRTLTFELSSPILYELGLDPALRDLAEQTARSSTIPFSFDTDRQPRSLTVDVSVLLLRVARELTRNVVKHAGAHAARIAVVTVGDEVHLRIEDDGVGLDDSGSRDTAGTDGFGLWSIREHLRAIGGRLEIESKRGTGTRALVVAPLDGNGEA